MKILNNNLSYYFKIYDDEKKYIKDVGFFMWFDRGDILLCFGYIFEVFMIYL